MKGINAARTSAGAEGPSEKRVCGYFHELSNKRKKTIQPKTVRLIPCLPQANQMLTVDSLLNCKGKRFKNNLYSSLCVPSVWFLDTLK